MNESEKQSEVGGKDDTSSRFGGEIIDKHEEEDSSMLGEIRSSSMGLGNDFPEPEKRFFSKS